MYKSNVVNPNDSPVNNVCLVLFNNHYYPLTSLSAWYGQYYVCIECEVCYNSNHTCKPAFRNSTCFRKHSGNGVCDNSKCDTYGERFIGPVLDHVCNIVYCSYCSQYVKPDHQCFIEVKKRSDLMSWKYVFYDFECTQYTIDTETKRAVHEFDYCIARNVCDKCPDDGSCDNCLPVDTFSGVGGENALENFVPGRLIILSMKGQYLLYTTVVIRMPIL